MVESNISANEKNKFSVSLLAFWVKGSIIADNNFVHIDMPNTVLFGLIPAGKNKKSIPLQSISNAEESNWYKIANMIFGIIIAIAGFYSFQEEAFGGLVLVLLGILLFLTGFKFRMTIERNSGVTESIDVPFFEGEKLVPHNHGTAHVGRYVEVPVVSGRVVQYRAKPSDWHG